ncbi:hypothetical protein C7212DRAFT_345846 [Tuber magnatum]|uniref:Uncharacterized protein n=1 Tax=Tuber magnatum TaxID=42249 RepID=A0A317SKU6_9PEZI|nr:hypothetical protein C7212DRAFT_345846 [Tuber magnatum]
MPQEKRILRSSKGVNDGVAILFEAMGVDCKPYPVVTAGSKDPYPGWFGTSRKQFSDAPKACTRAEIDSDLAEMRAQPPKPPVKFSQHAETAEVLELVRAAFPVGTKQLRVVLKIPVSGGRIAKKPPVLKKPKSFKIPKTSMSVESFKMPATLNRPKPVKSARAPSPEKAILKESQPPVRRSPRIKNSLKVSY